MYKESNETEWRGRFHLPLWFQIREPYSILNLISIKISQGPKGDEGGLKFRNLDKCTQMEVRDKVENQAASNSRLRDASQQRGHESST